jgi:folate-binding protein YgfZ
VREGIDGYLFGEDVTLADATDEHAPLELVGPAAGGVVARVLGTAPDLAPRAWRRGEWNGATVEVTALSVAGRPGLRLDAGPAGADALWHELVGAGATPGGIVARDILRVEAGSALFGVDVDDGVYPQEARLDDAFSLEKGCYTGQEVVAKIDTYGGLNKLLLPLRVDHDDPVAHGTRILGRGGEDEGRDLGVVTSWAYSFVLDTGLVLAYVKRRHQEPGTSFSLGESAGYATIVDVVAP